MVREGDCGEGGGCGGDADLVAGMQTVELNLLVLLLLNG